MVIFRTLLLSPFAFTRISWLRREDRSAPSSSWCSFGDCFSKLKIALGWRRCPQEVQLYRPRTSGSLHNPLTIVLLFFNDFVGFSAAAAVRNILPSATSNFWRTTIRILTLEEVTYPLKQNLKFIRWCGGFVLTRYYFLATLQSKISHLSIVQYIKSMANLKYKGSISQTRSATDQVVLPSSSGHQ